MWSTEQEFTKIAIKLKNLLEILAAKFNLGFIEEKM